MVRSVTLAIMILHNLLVDNVGAEATVQRFGLSEAFEHDEHTGISGNVLFSSKGARNALRDYFARRDGLR